MMNEDGKLFLDKEVMERLLQMGAANQEQTKQNEQEQAKQTDREQAIALMASMLGNFNQQLKKSKIDAPLRRALVLGLQQHLLK